MKKNYLLALFLLFSLYSFAQQKIRFEYDTAGNQILREFCFNCNSRTPSDAKQINEITENDLKKFDPQDGFSYYPNPLKETLYLQWNDSNQSKIKTINLISVNGVILNSISNLEKTNNYVVNFEQYPVGVYMLLLVYENSFEKTIKIIKQ